MLAQTRALPRDLSGQPVLPTWSLRPGTLWALELIAAAGFRLDCGLCPAGTPGCGTPGVTRGPMAVRLFSGRQLREFPPSVLPPLGLGLSGGFFLRNPPLGSTVAALRDAEARGVPLVLYVHPWEVDPEPPRVRLPALWAVARYGGLPRMADRMEQLLGRYRFAPLGTLADHGVWSRVPTWVCPEAGGAP